MEDINEKDYNGILEADDLFNSNDEWLNKDDETINNEDHIYDLFNDASWKNIDDDFPNEDDAIFEDDSFGEDD